jgi:hypothetical protein
VEGSNVGRFILKFRLVSDTHILLMRPRFVDDVSVSNNFWSHCALIS